MEKVKMLTFQKSEKLSLLLHAIQQAVTSLRINFVLTQSLA